MLKAAKMGDADLMKSIIVSNDTLKIPEVWLSIVDKKGRSALHIAAINRSMIVVRFIANEIISTIPNLQTQEQYFNAPDEKGRTPLFFSAALGFLDITKLLLNRGVKIDSRTNGFHPAPGSTPLMATAEKGHVKCFAALMDSGADIFEQRLDGADALYLATREGRKKIIEMIVNTDKMKIVCRDIINRPTYRNRTAIHTSAFHGYLGIAHLLFEHGAELDIPDEDGFTPLILAAHEGHFEIVKWLIEKGVSICKKDKFGDTALETSEINGHIEIMKYLTLLAMLDGKHRRKSKKPSAFPKAYKLKKLCDTNNSDLKRIKDLTKTINVWSS